LVTSKTFHFSYHWDAAQALHGGGEEGWKEKMADKILARQKDKDAAAGGGGGGDGDDQPPVA